MEELKLPNQTFVIGAGGHGRVVCEALQAAGGAQVVGFVDDTVSIGTVLCGVPVVGRLSQLEQLAKNFSATHCAVAAGDNAVRRQLVETVERCCPTLSFASVIHPGAQVAPSASVAAGSVVLAGAIVATGATVGSHCILNTGSQLDHDSRLGNFASLAPRAVTGGGVSIGAGSAVGLGASVIHGIAIGVDSVVGAGAVVVRDVPDAVVVVGVPAQVTSSRQRGDRYL